LAREVSKEKVGEGLVRKCVAEEIGKRLGSNKYPGNSREAPELVRLLELTIIEPAGSA